MERSRVLMKPINGNQQHSVFDMEEPSPPFVFLPPKTITIRDASFSSYLIPPQQQQQQLHNQVDDNELSIFDAQKYFNESSSSNSNNDPRVSNRVSSVKVINLESIPRFSSASSSLDGYGRNYRTRSFHATPTASSEASWNSQTGLLSNPPGAIVVSMQNPHPGDEKKKGLAKKWFLSRRCPCAGKKSVQVEEKLSESTTPSHLTHKHKDPKNVERQNPACEEKNWVATDWLQRQQMVPNSQISADNKGIAHQRVLAASVRALSNDGTSGFSFPVLNHTSSSLSSRKLTLNPPIEDPPRDSLEVFRPPASPKSRMTITDDDVGSDASSDLFEIESFSTQTTYHRRDSMDENSNLSNNGRRLYCKQSLDESMNMMMTPISSMECYEPSEASIDWSVTTAEGFERASVANFSEADRDDYLAEINRDGGGGSGGSRGGKGGGRGGLLSCRSEKAVSVGPKAVKCVGSTTMRHVSSRPPSANKPPLARSHSARLSVPFAT